ncbi:MAG: CBS domain-containing protein [Candidatus Competibacter denitrificans]|jgi:signal-transduction protein with cAMP-binding, CBS, and nucleotidyltransferase domain|uniref:Signal transduction protein with CBS domains n=1 Tax=Candidatus Competibacter denitrificans Run_A_D11 TaxID=1400863 RepID=W6M966_9GAMM|nr:CBS domain-containing protein [Candidatus Competibacter denitrificans]CDI02295.1 putative signal transduction protein with CBS domains [Candidatus Competibacter denitrificans Run_A_D11]HAS86005.1 CBS domain-containing protein [Candidatus Competibacteraceae bacterium]HRC69564.1 CBS domain-containing protein [Candidatus Competibacter denitrificans]
MKHAYQALPLHGLDRGIHHARPKQQLPRRITIDDPALSVMTDLCQITAITIDLTTPLTKAVDLMIRRRVRILLVCDADDAILGVLTSRDIDSEKAARIIAKTGISRDELLVSDVMTLRPKLQVLMMEDVLGARIGDIIATLRQVSRQHALVLDTDPENDIAAVRGIFSLAEIGLRLGLNINRSQQPTTYAELEKAGATV